MATTYANIRALRRQLEMLTYPAEEAEAQISQVSEALRKQAEELSRFGDKATVDIGQLSTHCVNRKP